MVVQTQDPGEVGVEAGDEPEVQTNGAEASPPAKTKQGKPTPEVCAWCRTAHGSKPHLRPLPEGKTLEEAIAEQQAAIPSEIPGLTTSGDGGGSAAYAKRKAEIDAAKARGKKTPAKGKASGKGKAKETAAERKAREKAAAKAKTDKQKEREAARAKVEKERKDARAAAEKARKEKIARDKAERAAKRAQAATPDLIGKESKAVQQAFAEDYAMAGPKTDRNPNGLGVRRAKSDRGDFAAGYIMMLKRWRAGNKSGKTAAAV